ncbi:MAG: DUF5985 family protein [Gemmataceae bacterium]
MHDMMTGAIAMGFFVASAFFLQFWGATRDRLFVLFAGSFLILAINRIFIGIYGGTTDDSRLYWVRLAAFALILLAIFDKNRDRALGNERG